MLSFSSTLLSEHCYEIFIALVHSISYHLPHLTIAEEELFAYFSSVLPTFALPIESQHIISYAYNLKQFFGRSLDSSLNFLSYFLVQPWYFQLQIDQQQLPLI